MGRPTARPALLLAAILALAVVAPASAGKRPNPYKGKSLYKANCKVCHVEQGAAKNLTPISKTQAQWKRFFDGKKLAGCVGRVKEKTQVALGEDDLANIQFFLVSHAADSDQPETCGD